MREVSLISTFVIALGLVFLLAFFHMRILSASLVLASRYVTVPYMGSVLHVSLTYNECAVYVSQHNVLARMAVSV